MRNIGYLLLTLLMLYSCTDPEYKAVIGAWEIVRVVHNSTEIPVIETFMANGISFDKDGTCFIPEVRGTDRQPATWNVIRQNDTSYLKLVSGNHYLNGTFRISMYRDSLLHMIIISESTTVLCSKFLSSWDYE